MPSNFKKLVRARMEKTGESWQTAARHVRAQGAPEPDSGGQRENGGRMDEEGGGGFKSGDQGASAAWKVLLAGVAALGWKVTRRADREAIYRTPAGRVGTLT